MYDTDEEIKRKRRTLFIIIGIIVFLILLLIIFLFTRNRNQKKDPSDVNKEITCTLEVQDGITPDSNGVYHQPITVGFKNITAISKDYPISKQAIGTSDNSRNKDTFTATKSGKYHLYGYVQDSVGHKGKCELSLTINLSSPACELEVTNGTLGDNGWYRSDVEVGFSAMDANNSTLSIVKYYIEKEITSLDTNDAVKADPPTENIEKYTVKDNQVTTLVGHIFDSAGNEGTCKITVKKDSTIPTCTLQVLSGTKNDNGEYTDNPVIGINEAKDDVSEVAGKGVGVAKNYNQDKFTVTEEGKTTVVGYVKDKAGNEGTCSLEVARPTSSGSGNGGGNGGGGTTPTKTSKPSCTISLTVPKTDQVNVYSQSVTAKLTYGTTNGATITDYGLAETETYNQRTEITISNNGTHTIYGIVKDSYGHIARCSTPAFVIDKGDLLYTKVQVGDYVAYDAGTWNETRTAQNIDGYYWGMTSGSSKNNGVICDKDIDTGTRNGWMVFNVINNEVYLIHAGTPECIYHGRTSSSAVISTMKSEAGKYVNTKYAHGSTVLSCNLSGFSCTWNTFKDSIYLTGTHYWIAEPGENYTIYSISPKGSKQPYNKKSLGLRPIVILNTGVKTTGKNSSGAWVLK